MQKFYKKEGAIAMNMQIKSSNGIALVPLESRLMAEGKIFIEGKINQENGCIRAICLKTRFFKGTSHPRKMPLTSNPTAFTSYVLPDCLQRQIAPHRPSMQIAVF
ncbi:hypothetical protein D3Z53_04075 [Lachnospiraceae bacterium]|jgi:hypothetical protein|nr:hypothetical protein [Lachnospiraceae bacterium]